MTAQPELPPDAGAEPVQLPRAHDPVMEFEAELWAAVVAAFLAGAR